MRALKMRSAEASPQKLTTTNWEQSSKLVLLQLHKKLLKNSASTILWSFGIWSKLERWKSSISGCLMSWPKIKKKKSFWSVFSYSTWQQQTISWSDCDVWQKVDFIQLVMTSSVVGETPKHFPKPNLHRKLWSLFGGLLPVWSTKAFWIPAKPLHLRSMFSKLMRCTENCNTCIQHWSTERAWFFSVATPNHILHNQFFKSWMNWAMEFCLIRHIQLTSHQPMTTFSSILTTFCRQNAPTSSRRQIMLSKSLSNSKAQIFMLQE